MTDQPPAADRLDTYVVVAERPPPRTASWRRAATAIGVVVALVAGLFGVAALTSDGGSDSPEAAVTRLVEALEHEDVLGALAALVPAERALLRDRVVQLSQELGRLGIIDADLDLNRVPGADLSVEGLELETGQLAEDVAVVRASAGTARLHLRGAELPIGPVLDGLVEDAERIPSPDPADLTGDHTLLVAVRRDGNWFVSLGYTVAELARREAGGPVPSFGRGVEPRGAPSPEAAVRRLAAAGAALDVRGAIELAPPGEGDALHDYAPLFLPGAERAVSALRAQGVSAAVPTLELKVDGGDGEALVTVERIAVEVESQDGRFRFEYDGRCISITAPDGSVVPPQCRDDEDPENPFRNSTFTYFQLTTVERGGAWFVSPTGSIIDAMLRTMRVFERDQLAQIVQKSPFALFLLFSANPLFYGERLLAGGHGGNEESSGSASSATVTAPSQPASAKP